MKEKNSHKLLIFFAFSIFFLLSVISILNLSEYIQSIPEKKTSGICQDCNLIIVSIDTLRADHITSFGYFRNTTPNIDSFSENALVFKKAYASSPWTLPSHVSIFTGMHPHVHGVETINDIIGNQTQTMADILHQAGYKTAMFSNVRFLSERYNWHTFDHFDVVTDTNRKDENFPRMLKWIRQNQNWSFMVFWHTYRLHAPYNPQPEFDIFSDKNYSGKVNVAPDFNDPVCAVFKNKQNQQNCFRKSNNYFNKLLPNLYIKDFKYIIDKYDGEILQADHMFGELITELDALGISDKTLIVLVSDHGESFGVRKTHPLNRIGHNINFEDVLHIPIIIKVPSLTGRIIINKTVSHVDIMPTVLYLLGIDLPRNSQKISGINLIRKMHRKEEPVFSEAIQWYGEVDTITFNQSRLSFYKNNETFELYDLIRDPYERYNIFGRNRTEEAILAPLLLDFISGQGSKGESDEMFIDEDLRAELMALGYLN